MRVLSRSMSVNDLDAFALEDKIDDFLDRKKDKFHHNNSRMEDR